MEVDATDSLSNWCNGSLPNANTSTLRVYMRSSSSLFGCTWCPRLLSALRQFAPPHVCWAAKRDASDLEIAHIDSYFDVDFVLDNRNAKSPPFIVLQHSYHMSKDDERVKFARAWARSILLVSFNDLSEAAAKAQVVFHPMPWGTDSETFVPLAEAPSSEVTELYADSGNDYRGHKYYSLNNSEPYVVIVGATDLWWDGYGDIETHTEVLIAAARAGLRVRHLGDRHNVLCLCATPGSNNRDIIVQKSVCEPSAALGGKAACDFHDNLGRVSTKAYVEMIQGARYVAALRKFEGFEMPAVEALLCGVRPLVYRIQSYRWYGNHAVYIPSGLDSDQVTEEIYSKAFSKLPEPINQKELEALRQTFAWQTLVPTLFARAVEQIRVRRLDS